MINNNSNNFHVAIIPDGNRRWAKLRDLPVWEGHRQGAQVMEKLTDYAYERGVTHLSLWGSSLENMTKRPLLERKALLEIYSEYFARLTKRLQEDMKNVKVQVIGRWREKFPGFLIETIDNCQAVCAQKSAKILTIFLAYSGDDEMIEAVRKIAQSGVGVEGIDGNMIKQNLRTHNLPTVDLMIRTGGEPHLSAGFMMWQMANAQLYFTDLFFPEFLPDKFEEALQDFAARGRRLGR